MTTASTEHIFGTLWASPVPVCAVVNLGIGAIGLPAEAFRCGCDDGRLTPPGYWPTVPDSRPLCPSCNGTGHVVPDGEHQILLGATTVPPESELLGHGFTVIAPAWDWPQRFLTGPGGTEYAIPVGALVGAAKVRFLPIVDGFGLNSEDMPNGPGPWVRPRVGGMFNERKLELIARRNGLLGYIDITPALAFSSFTVGGVAAVLTDITTEIDCPECGGEGGWRISNQWGEPEDVDCELCRTDGRLVFPQPAPGAPAEPRWEAA